MQMRRALQASVDPVRKEELLRRCVKELAEFLGCDERLVNKVRESMPANLRLRVCLSA